MYEAGCYPRLKDLPSWAANWAGDIAQETVGWATNSKGEKTFKASDCTFAKMSIEPDDKLLRVRAILVDEIKALAKPLE